jgi:hypothetical protein
MASTLESLAQGLTITEYPDWVKFVERLNEAVRAGRVREIPVLEPFRGGGRAISGFSIPRLARYMGMSHRTLRFCRGGRK